MERLPDRISIGVLARTFTNEALEEVIDEAGVREQRYRLLPARLVLVFVLACWLFTRSGYQGVMGKLSDAHVLGRAGAGGWRVPTDAALTRARARLGPAPLRLLFARVAGPCGTPETPGVFYRQLRVATGAGSVGRVVDGSSTSQRNARKDDERECPWGDDRLPESAARPGDGRLAEDVDGTW